MTSQTIKGVVSATMTVRSVISNHQ